MLKTFGVVRVVILLAITCSNVSNSNTRTTFEICSKLTIKTPEHCHWLCSGVYIVNFEHILNFDLLLLLLTLNKKIPVAKVEELHSLKWSIPILPAPSRGIDSCFNPSCGCEYKS